ncbi:MAG: hypothetical protein AAF416_13755 [Pseudomonadota bacterium]
MPTRSRIPSFSPFLYRYRNLAERFFNKIMHYLALVKCAAVQIWLRSCGSAI